MRDMQVKQDRMQQQLDQRFSELGDFIAAVSNDAAQLAENQQQQDIRMAQLTANVESLVNALQNRFTGNGGG